MQIPTVISLDPGVSGAAVTIRPPRIEWIEYSKVSPFQIFAWLRFEQKQYPPVKVYMEAVHSRPGDFGPQLGKFLRQAGMLDGFLIALQIPVEYVEPQVWQREFNLGGTYPTRNARKKAQHEKAKELFPHLKVTRDLADAILIAEYGRRKEYGELKHGRSESKERREGEGIRWKAIQDLP